MSKKEVTPRKKYMSIKIRTARVNMCSSQEKFAEYLNISEHACSRLENAWSFPREETLIRFTKYYEGDLRELFDTLNEFLDAEVKNKE